MLDFYAIAVTDENLAYALGDPRITGDQMDELLSSLMDDISGQEQELSKCCAKMASLQLLPEIAALYNEFRASAEGTIDASVVSAFRTLMRRR